ncbi:YvrJ family protein [Ammoniphilus sp. CFH 90114]|uniref:YvrJ family protein n=1 Tax=Ammoniphilus sp. CFH 90114 TaxID=2493665 RepID=UPI00196A6447
MSNLQTLLKGNPGLLTEGTDPRVLVNATWKTGPHPTDQQSGFPHPVSWYLLTRVESKMEALTSSIADMTQAIHGWQKET